jgi:transposase
MRVTTAFNKILAPKGASVAKVCFRPEGVVVVLSRRPARHRCPCGRPTWASYDRSVRRWRHLDLGASRCYFEAEIARVDCAACGRVRTEEVPWARPRARHTALFEDTVAWLAQRTDKSTVAKLLRVSWEAVAAIVVRVVASNLSPERFEGVRRIGVDEVSHRKGHRYLTVVADHDRDGAVLWAAEGKSAATLARFYDDVLGVEKSLRLEAVSMDMGPAYAAATLTRAPFARQCVDPFHVVALANRALERCRQRAWNEQRRSPLPAERGARAAQRRSTRWIKHTRWALLKDPSALDQGQLGVLSDLRRQRSVLYRAWQLKEALRDLYRIDPAHAPAHLEWWLRWAARSRLVEFVALAKTIRLERERILAAIELGLSNSKLEGLNSKIRLINHRGYGHHSAAALIGMIYLCCGGMTIELPGRGDSGRTLA